jgi:hypothetical protein
MPNKEPIVAVLGDSRVFDTYFTNAAYGERYGYDATFPHLLRKRALESGAFDVVHIPDHFRGATVENNIIRLALVDPAVVVLCDGIWETLVHKDWFIEWATNQIKAHSTLSPEELDLSYSSRRLADLFIADALPVSPRKYAAKQARIISYFRRRRRQCIWLSLPMPPRDHLNRLHYAGNYRCIPEWDECLAAINDAMAPVVANYGAVWFDLHQLALSQGGFAHALIDQWHFSRAFHAAIAAEFAQILPAILRDSAVPDRHLSRSFMLARPLGTEPVALLGPPEAIAQWRAANRGAQVEAVLAGKESSGRGNGAVPIEDAKRLTARCVVAVAPSALTPSDEGAILKALPPDGILLYADELGGIVNPTGSDRAEHGQLR